MNYYYYYYYFSPHYKEQKNLLNKGIVRNKRALLLNNIYLRSIQFNLSRKYKLKFLFINGIRTFELKYTLFKLVFEVNGLEERCS